MTEDHFLGMQSIYKNFTVSPDGKTGDLVLSEQWTLKANRNVDPEEWRIHDAASGEFFRLRSKGVPGAMRMAAGEFICTYKDLEPEEAPKDPVENLKAGGFEFEETQTDELTPEEKAKLEREENEHKLEALENGEIEKPGAQKWNAGGAKALAKKQSIDSKVLPVPEKMRALQISELTTQDIVSYLCPNATEKEAIIFLRLCQARGLNPFLNEAYLIKYGSNDPAQIVVGKETFTRRAELSQAVDGFEAGIIVRTENGSMERRTGTFMLPEETLLGGWAKVYRNDKTIPYSHEVAIAEYIGRKRDGTVTKFWREKPATMIRKVALVQVLREALPSEFSGMYDAAEVNIVDAEYEVI